MRVRTTGTGHRFRSTLSTLAALGLLTGPAAATVFHARDEALRLAFPDGERVEARDLFLTPEQKSQVEHNAGAALESSLVTVYVGHKEGRVVGYAFFDTHVVRTMPETFLIVAKPSGEVAATYLLAFYEPLEYSPSARWLDQFTGRSLTDDVVVGRGIAAITGSTLSSRAVTASVRRALALFSVLPKGS